MTDSITENASTTFLKEGKTIPTKVVIRDERRIGGNAYGEVFEAEVAIGDHNRKFVIKKFKEKTNALTAINNYSNAKAAGLKVFTTYRLGEDGASILMTDGNSDSTICVGNTSLQDMGKPKIKGVDKDVFIKMTSEVFEQAQLAAKHGIVILPDSLFFLIDNDYKRINFVVGDLDNVIKKPTSTTQLPYNLSSLHVALEEFLNKNMENPDEYKKIGKDMYAQYLKELVINKLHKD